MNNLDWLCENDREQLMKLLAEGDSCEYCAFEIEDDCGIRCNEGVRAWLDAEHNDGSAPETVVSAEDVDTNDAKVIQIGEKYKLADADDAEVVLNREKYKLADADTREKLQADIDDCFWLILEDEKSDVLGWLDRQAAITEREQAERIRQLEQVVQADKEDCAQSFADMKVMENQRDRLNKQVAELRGAVCERDKRIARLEAYLDIAKRYNESLHDRLGEAMSYAMKIEKQTEVG